MKFGALFFTVASADNLPRGVVIDLDATEMERAMARTAELCSASIWRSMVLNSFVRQSA